MRKIIMLIVIMFAAVVSCAQTKYTNDSFIDGWEISIYGLNKLSGDYLIVFPGDSLSIRFDQILKSTPLSKQPGWGVGDTTGFKYSIYINRDDLKKVSEKDSIYTYNTLIMITLVAGSYSLVVRTKGTNGQYSRHSKPFWFDVVSLPPMMPVEIKLWIKR